jgi:uncharacterized surface protein with fasciclin (FAS1) repeats
LDGAQALASSRRAALAQADIATAGMSLREIEIFRSLVIQLKGVAELNSGAHTIFAPVDSAFFRLPESAVTRFRTDATAYESSRWPEVLWHHVAAGSFSPAQLKNDELVPMVDGSLLKITVRDGKLFVDDASVVDVVPVRNGLLYLIDSVLIPKSTS